MAMFPAMGGVLDLISESLPLQPVLKHEYHYFSGHTCINIIRVSIGDTKSAE